MRDVSVWDSALTCRELLHSQPLFPLGMFKLFFFFSPLLIYFWFKTSPMNTRAHNPHKPNDASFWRMKSQGWLRNYKYAKLINLLLMSRKTSARSSRVLYVPVGSVPQQLFHLGMCARTSVSCGKFHLKPFPVGGTDTGSEVWSFGRC